MESAWNDVKAKLDQVFVEALPGRQHNQVLKKLTDVQKALQQATAKQATQLAGAMARSVNREPKWIVGCMALSALGGVLALTAAVLHAVKQVNQLHDTNDESLASASSPKVHIDHYTPMMLALMSLLRWPHSIYIKDWKMLILQVVNVLVWGGITVYVWVNDPYPSLPHVDL